MTDQERWIAKVIAGAEMHEMHARRAREMRSDGLVPARVEDLRSSKVVWLRDRVERLRRVGK